jgi:hypothetical protein
MRSRILCALALSLVVVPASVATAKSVSKEFQEAWADREQRYAARSKEAEAQLPAALAELNSSANDPVTTKDRLDRLLRVTFDLGYNSARGQVVGDTKAFVEKKPSAERAQLWLQDQADQLRERARSADEKAAVVKNRTPGGDGDTTQSRLKNLGMAVFEAATVKGMADELTLIDQNLAIYYPAKNVEDQRRRQARAAALGAIGQAMQASASQDWMATCMRAGQTMSCMGN